MGKIFNLAAICNCPALQALHCFTPLVNSSHQSNQGNRVKVNYAENLISMRKNSLKLSEKDKDTESSDPPLKGKDERGRKGGRKKYAALPSYSISFSYDSLVPAVVRIFIGATDRATTQHLR